MKRISDNQKFMRHTVRCSKTDYENLIAICPACGKENIFNRASDLPGRAADIDKFRPVSREVVRCEDCNIQFPIGGDLLGESYQYFIWDCDGLIKQKKYMFCILNLCQACESFFLKGIVIKLLFIPFRRSVFGAAEHYINDISKYENFSRISELLYKKIENYTYSKMKNIFVDLYLSDMIFSSIETIEEYIVKLKNLPTISDDCIDKSCTEKKKDLLNKLLRFDINEIRNRVVHKYAYRPTLDETKLYLEQTRMIIGGLHSLLGFDDYYHP